MNFTCLALAALLLACALFAASPPVLAQSDAGRPDVKKMRALVNDRCAHCHSLARVKRHVGRFDESGWLAIVGRMQLKGAAVSDEEKAAIAGFLASLKSGAGL